MLESYIKESSVKVAVIMSVYIGDKPDFLDQAINSLVNQTFKYINIYICVDGPIGCQLNNILKKYQGMDNIDVIFSEINSGLACSLNLLIDTVSLSEYKYIARMDSDDICFVNRIEEQVRFMEKNKFISVSGTFCEEFGSDIAISLKKLPTKHEHLINFSVTRCPFIHPSVIFRTSIFIEGYRYPTNTAFTEDMALWFELLSHGKKFANLDKVLIKYRMDDNTLKRRKGMKKLISEFSLRYKFMQKEKLYNTKRLILLILKSLMYLMPVSINKFLYKYLR